MWDSGDDGLHGDRWPGYFQMLAGQGETELDSLMEERKNEAQQQVDLQGEERNYTLKRYSVSITRSNRDGRNLKNKECGRTPPLGLKNSGLESPDRQKMEQ